MNDTRLCFFGDSFTNGTCDPEKRGWVGRLQSLQQPHITVYNLGIRGNTSSDILERWQREATLRLPEHTDNRLVFSFGVNDTTIVDGQFRLSEMQSIDTGKQILDTAKSSYKTIMIGPPPISDASQNERIHSLDMALHRLCVEIDVPYLSVFEDLADNDIWMEQVARNDGAHPKAAGYSEFAKLVENWHAWWFKKY